MLANNLSGSTFVWPVKRNAISDLYKHSSLTISLHTPLTTYWLLFVPTVKVYYIRAVADFDPLPALSIYITMFIVHQGTWCCMQLLAVSFMLLCLFVHTVWESLGSCCCFWVLPAAYQSGIWNSFLCWHLLYQISLQPGGSWRIQIQPVAWLWGWSID